MAENQNQIQVWVEGQKDERDHWKSIAAQLHIPVSRLHRQAIDHYLATVVQSIKQTSNLSKCNNSVTEGK